MEKNPFDSVGAQYEKVHDRHLPPGMESKDFLEQKVERVMAWIDEFFPGGPSVSILDFGCGTGRSAERLLNSEKIGAYVGIDDSFEALKEAYALTRVIPKPSNYFVDLDQLEGRKFQVALAFNVFHHVVPERRLEIARKLKTSLEPGGILILWEHNPLNPLTQWLVKSCPFDEDAVLIRRKKCLELFESAGFKTARTEFINCTPPRWQKISWIQAIEKQARTVPFGAQYWAIFKN